MAADAMEDRELLRGTFDLQAERYHRVRPDYPEQIFDDLFEIAALEPGVRVLEVGCGTGQATRPLARRGCRIVCIELGGHLAAIARRELAQFREVEVFAAPFESFEPREAGFDLVLAASSWRWVDPSMRYQKAARTLRSGGSLAIIDGGHHVFPPGFDPFFKQIQEYYESIGERVEGWPAPDEVPDLRGEFEKTGLFGRVELRRYVWTVDYSADQYIDLLNTYSGHIAMTSAARERIFAGVHELMANRADRPIRKHYLSILHVARLVESSEHGDEGQALSIDTGSSSHKRDEMREEGDSQVNPRKYGNPPYRVVLVHGGPGALGEMAPVARELSRDRGILEPLQTARTLDGQVKELALQIEGGAQIPVTLVGHSWGAFLGFIVAARYPALVRKLILVSSGPFDAQYVPLIMKTRLSRLKATEQNELASIRQRLHSSSGEDRNRLFARFGQLLSKADQCEPIATGSEALKVDTEAFAAVWKEAEDLRARGGLLASAPEIRCPVVAIHGDYDPHPAEGVEKPLSGSLKTFTFVLLERCGHTPWLEKHARERFYVVLRQELS